MEKEKLIDGVLCRFHKETYTWISEDGESIWNQFWKEGELELRNPYVFDDFYTNERFIQKKILGKIYIKDIVAQTWGPTKPVDCWKCHLKHKDGDPQNDSAFNLEWIVENMKGDIINIVDYQKR